jgi:hypothetical protein
VKRDLVEQLHHRTAGAPRCSPCGRSRSGARPTLMASGVKSSVPLGRHERHTCLISAPSPGECARIRAPERLQSTRIESAPELRDQIGRPDT